MLANILVLVCFICLLVHTCMDLGAECHDFGSLRQALTTNCRSLLPPRPRQKPWPRSTKHVRGASAGAETGARWVRKVW